MSKDNAIAPAFPVASVANANGEMQWGTDGLTKREYFAARAMQGLCANSIVGRHRQPDRMAEEARMYADALLAELAK